MDPETPPAPNDAPAAPAPAAAPRTGRVWPDWRVWAPLALALAALASSALLWDQLDDARRQLALQSAESGQLALEAKTLSRDAQAVAREALARFAVLEARVNEVALQRGQLEELIQSMSRSRDENLVVDIDSAVRLAQQQSVLTGSVEPLLAALRSASQRVARAAQPRLNALQRAIERDIEMIRAAKVADIPAQLVKLDELVRLVDGLPTVNAAASAQTGMDMPPERASRPQELPPWWQRLLGGALDEARGLVRVSRIENPEAALLAPEHAFFLRENLKLKLLNARLGLIARHSEAVQADLDAAAQALARYFDANSRKTQLASSALKQVQGQLKTLELPRVDNTLTALAVAAAGR
jgi:uroporphyrin-3 C-methyltransferase